MSKKSEKTIFLDALDLEDAGRRRAFVEDACGGDEGLRQSVEQLLRAHEQPDHFIDDPAVKEDSLPGKLTHSAAKQTLAAKQTFAAKTNAVSPGHEDVTVVSRDASDSNARATALGDSGALVEGEASSDVGRQIDDYKIMELIGEGGFGLVYVAQQSKPVRRSVALKILKPGMSSKEVLARFAAERQAVAMMDHPNIAQVFDAGVTDDGRPYFAMELVKGVPITEFCEQHGLRLHQRVELMRDVCLATHHAHQKGVIHRDLKPSNVLVTLHDDRPVAKIIDFGVAKAIGQNLSEQTIYTRFFSMIGTPLYMSPEQASMNALDVDTRSDVFSLGVLLYELLAGRTPFERQRLDSVGYDEMRRIIMEEEPPKPSTCLTTVIEANKRTVVDRPAGMRSAPQWEAIPVDLDWIVMKAMEKDRTRRYESAAALAGDLRSFLANEQVTARPPSPLYRMSKFVQRNRVAFATSSLVAFALLVGTGVSVYLALEAIDQREAKNIALQDALVARDEMESFTTRLKDANVAVERARLFEQSEQYGDAYVAYTAAVQGVPNYYMVWVQRAVLLAQFGLFEEAASDYAEALSMDAPVSEYQWNGAAALFLLAGRDGEFRLLYDRMLQNLEANDDAGDAHGRWLALRGCLVAPASREDALQLVRLSEELLKTPEDQRPPNFLDGILRSGPFNPWSGRPPADGNQRGNAGQGSAGQGSTGQGRAGPGGEGPSNGRDDATGRPQRPDALSQAPGTERGPDRGPERGAERDFGRRRRGEFSGGPGGGPGGGSRGMAGRGPSSGIAGPPLPPGVRFFVAAWAYQRAGKTEPARDYLAQARRDQGWKGGRVLDALEALVLIDDGQQEQAQELLQRSAANIKKQLEDGEGHLRSRHVWFDLIEHVFLHREALSKLDAIQPEQADAISIASELTRFQDQSRAALGGSAGER